MPEPSIHDKIAKALDEALLDLITNGRPEYDDEGNCTYVPASAADLNAARNRLRDLGLTKVPAEGDETDQLRAAVLDGKYPHLADLDDEEDDKALAS